MTINLKLHYCSRKFALHVALVQVGGGRSPCLYSFLGLFVSRLIVESMCVRRGGGGG
jgi:hypothetical protein